MNSKGLFYATSVTRRAVYVLAVFYAGIATAQATEIVIAEVDTNEPDAVEFANVSGDVMDISGWKVYVYERTAWPSPVTVQPGTPSFTFPPGTLIDKNAIFVLYDLGQALSPDIVDFNFPFGLAWNSGNLATTAILLLDETDAVIDFVMARGIGTTASPGDITIPFPLPASEWIGSVLGDQSNPQPSFHRFGSADTNTRDDWAFAPENIGEMEIDLNFPGLAPRVVTISLLDPSPTTGPLLRYEVEFTEAVLGLEIGTGPSDDFALTVTGGSLSGIEIEEVIALSPTRFQVNASVAAGNGALRLDVLYTGGITDTDGRAMTEGYTEGPSYIIDADAPALQSVTTTPAGFGTIIEINLFFDEPMNTAVPPEVQILTAANGAIMASAATLGGDGAWISPSQYRVSLDRATVTEDHGSATLQVASAEDIAGNAMAVHNHSLFIDTVPPLVTVETNTTADTSPDLAGTVTDDSAIALMQITVDGQVVPAVIIGNQWTVPTGTLTPLALGTYDIAVQAVDAVGNVGIDTTLNELTISSNFLAVEEVLLLDPSPTNKPVVRFQVDFSSAVTGIELGAGVSDDFEPIMSGGLSGAAVVNVEALAAHSYAVEVAIGDQDGNIALRVLSTGNIENVNGFGLSANHASTANYLIEHLRLDTSLPPSLILVSGERLELSVAAAGGTPPYAFEWQFAPVAAIREPISAATPTLVLMKVRAGSAGQYFCVVSDAYEILEAGPMELQVLPKLPVSGGLGLALLASLLAGAGAVLTRRKDK
jgi:hypothetical protein